MPAITIVTLVGSVDRVVRLARSLRHLGGHLADVPILALHPEDVPPDPAGRERLEAAGARALPFPRGGVPNLPFAWKVAAAANAEAEAGTRVLVWFDEDTLVVAPPSACALQEAAAAYRPVHHRNIGVPWGRPLDEFWNRVFSLCDVPESRDRAMVTHAGEVIHAYLNAGSFAVDRGRGLMGTWRERFAGLPEDAVLAEWCARSEPHSIFAHQAVFTGVMLAALSPAEMVEMDARYNYPLHLHDEVPPDRRPGSLGDLVTVRYEDLLDGPRPDVPLLEPLWRLLEA